MVKIRLEGKFPNIIGLEDWERPLHLLEDNSNVLYLVTDWDYSSVKPSNSPKNKIFIGSEDEHMESVDEVIKVESLRDGGTTEIEFIKDSERGNIYIPSSLKKGLPSILTYMGKKSELRKMGYEGAYLFSVLREAKKRIIR